LNLLGEYHVLGNVKCWQKKGQELLNLNFNKISTIHTNKGCVTLGRILTANPWGARSNRARRTSKFKPSAHCEFGASYFLWFLVAVWLLLFLL